MLILALQLILQVIPMLQMIKMLHFGLKLLLQLEELKRFYLLKLVI